MKYVLLVCADPAIEPDTNREEMESWLARVGDRRLMGGELQAPEEASTIRVRGGRDLVTDGPFAETKEFVAGFDVIECATRGEILELAAAHPVARFGAIEVRELPGV
jgi:hypothetical protein